MSERVVTFIFDKSVGIGSPRAGLIFGDLHEQDNVVDDLADALAHRTAESRRFHQRVHKLEYTRHQVLKTDDLAC